MFHGNAEKDRVSSTGVKKMSELRLNAYRIMWLSYFSTCRPIPKPNGATRPVSQGIGKGRFRDDAILGLRPALRLQGKYGGPYPAGPQIDAAFRNDEHPERNGQTIRRDFEFLGQGSNAPVPKYLNNWNFFDIFVLQNGKTASNRLPQFAEHRFFRGTYGCNTLIINKCSA